jgi:hypothetical protein
MTHPELTLALVQARGDDLRRAARARGRSRPPAPAARRVEADAKVTLRLGSSADQKRLDRLAGLDSSAPLTPPVLLAEVDGEVRAALALSDGAVVADPFRPTLDLIDLLRARAGQVDADSRMRRSWRRRIRRVRRRDRGRLRMGAPGPRVGGGLAGRSASASRR